MRSVTYQLTKRFVVPAGVFNPGDEYTETMNFVDDAHAERWRASVNHNPRGPYWICDFVPVPGPIPPSFRAANAGVN